MKMKVTYGNCRITVIGMDLQCPLCEEMVLSGSMHECEGSEGVKALLPPKKRKTKNATR
jgi:hypothetical protein